MERIQQKYTAIDFQSSVRGEMRLAVALVEEASRLLKTKAARMPDCRPSVRLSKIALGLGEVGHSLQRAAIAIELAHCRKKSHIPPDTTCEVDEAALSKAEADLTGALRTLPIGSRQSRALFELRNHIRSQLHVATLSSRDERATGTRGAA